MATSSLSKTTLFGGTSYVISGLSTTFRTGSAHALERGAIVQNVAALHIAIGRPSAFSGREGISISQEIAGLRRLLFGWEGENSPTGSWFKKAAEVRPRLCQVV